MDRVEQLKFCKICLNKKKDFKRGLLCNLTDEPASFEIECPEFKVDVNEEYIEQLKSEPIVVNKDAANKDILVGSLWFFGGLIATVANFGYIFWGAILFGGIQMLKGISEYIKN